MGTVSKTVRQEGIAIGRVTSEPFTFTFVSGATEPTEDFADFRLFAGGILETPTGHTGSVYFQESDNWGGLSAGRTSDDTGADYAIADALGGRHPTLPAWFIRPGLSGLSWARRLQQRGFTNCGVRDDTGSFDACCPDR